MNKEAIKYHRPYLSREELETIYHALLAQSLPDTVLIRKIRNFNEEIDLKLRKSNYSTSVRVTQADKVSSAGLGFEAPAKQNRPMHKIDGEAASFKLENTPVDCSPQEIEQALEYRFDNDLMTPEESFEYQKKMGYIFTDMTYEESCKLTVDVQVDEDNNVTFSTNKDGTK